MIQHLPNDPVMLMSFVNTKLRDVCTDLDDFCATYGVDRRWLESKLHEAGYEYNKEQNKFW